MPGSSEDLSVLSRRRALTLPESRRLELALKSSDESLLLHGAGSDYDAMDTSRPGDEDFVERLAERAAVRYASPSVHLAGRAGPRRRRASQLGAAVLLAGVLAAGAWGIERTHRPAQATPADETPSSAVARPPGAAPARAPRSQVNDPDAPAPLTAAPSPAEPPPGAGVSSGAARQPTSPHGDAEALTGTSPQPSPSPAAVAVAPRANGAEPGPSVASPVDAATLFARANSERKAGDVARAVASYGELQRLYPSAPEALLSHVLTARLALRSGDFSGALAHFDRYLAAARNGALVEEALQGRAQALRALGRPEAERRTLEELVERFPKSIQARAARSRLASPP